MESEKSTPKWAELGSLLHEVGQAILWDQSDGRLGRPSNLSVGAIADELRRVGDLRGINLAGVDLTGAVLASSFSLEPKAKSGPLVISYPRVDKVSFDEAYLRGVVFNSADLRFVGFDRANLERAAFQDANLSGATFRNADLRHARFHGATIDGCNFAGANLQEADLHETHFDGANFEGANLRGANLSRATFSRANLSRAVLDGVDFSGVDLSSANFSGASLRQSKFRGANLTSANLGGLDVSGVDFGGATLIDADLSNTKMDCAQLEKAILRGANLRQARLVQTNLTGAALEGALVYGTSVWDVITDDHTGQHGLIITPGAGSKVTVDDIEVAQFIYMLLNNTKVRRMIDAVTSKLVLILGRFSEERKTVLDAIREELRHHNFTPVLFDFDTPASKDTTGTVETLARMARFIIADLSDPSSIPHELATIVPFLRTTPVLSLRLAGLEIQPYSMFKDLRAYPWVLPTYEYTDLATLIAKLPAVIGPADAMAEQFRSVR